MSDYRPPSRQTGVVLVIVGLAPVLVALTYLIGSGLGCGSGFSTADPSDYASECGIPYAAAAYFTLVAILAWPLFVLWFVALSQQA